MKAGDVIAIQPPPLKKPVAVRVTEIQDDAIVVIDGKSNFHVIQKKYVVEQLALNIPRGDN